MALKSVKLESIARRVILPVVALACLFAVYYSLKWCLANTVAAQGIDLKSLAQAGNLQRSPLDYGRAVSSAGDLAENMIEWSPNDPQTHYTLAVLNEKTFLPGDFEKSITEYEKAAALSPYDYRLWLELGKVRERNGDAAESEKILRRALELAPNYAIVHWTLGNVLMRQDKTDEGFSEIMRAAALDPKFSDAAISTAWQSLSGDINRIKQSTGDSPQINANFAVFLIRQKRFDEALGIWNALPENEKKNAFKKNGEEIFAAFIEAKKFRDALAVYKQIADFDVSGLEAGKIANGGFEEEVKTSVKSTFNWQIGDGLQPQIGQSKEQKHSGALSFLMLFNSSDGKAFRPVAQTVIVDSGKVYNFQGFYKSDLKTAATLKWEIADAADGKLLAATEAIAANSDWTSLSVEFTSPANAEAVVVRLARDACKSAICPIEGKVWFDDFSF